MIKNFVKNIRNSFSEKLSAFIARNIDNSIPRNQIKFPEDRYIHQFGKFNQTYIFNAAKEEKENPHPISRNLLLAYYHLDPEEQITAVEENPDRIAVIKNPTEECQIEAIKKKPTVIGYIKNPTFNACITAVEENPNTIVLIDVEEFPEIYEKYYFMKT